MDGRCPWCGTDPAMIAYHDTEWGVPQRDFRTLFETLALEGFQAGLSWRTILHRRAAFRRVFEGFDPERLAAWDDARIDRAAADPGIVRHRGKVAATVGNARAALRIEAREGFAAFLWSFTDGRPVQARPVAPADVPAQTDTARRLAKALAGEGFRFAGPTIAYAFMQAAGLVNDHLVTCPRQAAVAAMA